MENVVTYITNRLNSRLLNQEGVDNRKERHFPGGFSYLLFEILYLLCSIQQPSLVLIHRNDDLTLNLYRWTKFITTTPSSFSNSPFSSSRENLVPQEAKD